jgi:hypothetical protein
MIKAAEISNQKKVSSLTEPRFASGEIKGIRGLRALMRVRLRASMRTGTSPLFFGGHPKSRKRQVVWPDLLFLIVGFLDNQESPIFHYLRLGVFIDGYIYLEYTTPQSKWTGQFYVEETSCLNQHTSPSSWPSAPSRSSSLARPST